MGERLINIERTNEKKDGEPDRDVSIIDIIRHGETDYKEMTDPNFKFDPKSADFKLDAEHLDLNEKGIANIIQSAHDLAGKIDKENEAVLFYTSPNFRAQSSALLITDILRKNGIQILGSDNGRVLNTLKQIEIADQNLKTGWTAEYSKFLAEDSSHASWPMMKAHEEVAPRFGKKPQEVFGGSYQKAKENFENFIRHMVNIRKQLSAETQAMIGNKRIRVIAVTHEELPAQLLDEKMKHDQTLLRGQILELRPDALIKSGQTTGVEAVIYAKGDQPDVKRNFSISFGKQSKAK